MRLVGFGRSHVSQTTEIPAKIHDFGLRQINDSAIISLQTRSPNDSAVIYSIVRKRENPPREVGGKQKEATRRESRMISEQDVQAYKRDGVIMVPDVLGADTLAELRSVIAELVAGSATTLEHTDVYDLEPGHTAENPRVRRIKTPHKVHALFDQIVRGAAVLDILKQLIGPGLRLHGSKLNMKSAQYGSPVEWHQ